MDIKENVCETCGAEEIASAIDGEEKKASTALGKFKDADALTKAYGSLQAEFTRRSQRLRELEREVENLKENLKKEEKGRTGVEKLREIASSRKMEEAEFDKFLSDIEKANVSASPLSKEIVEPTSSSVGEDQIEQVEKSVVGENAGAFQNFVATSQQVTEKRVSSDELYQKVCADENVRLKIIGEYLSSIGKAGAPLMKAGVGVLAAPPLKAKSICEAGDMALRFFKTASKK